jgi:hypothetical protein
MPKVNPREVSDPKASFRIPFLDWRIADWENEFLQGSSIGPVCRGFGALNLRFLTSRKEILLINPSFSCFLRISDFLLAAPKRYNSSIL